MARTLEKNIEARAVRLLQARGCQTLKLNVMFRRSWPDRLVLAPNGVLFFIEFKRSGARPTPAQFQLHEQLRKLGQRVFVCQTAVEAVEVLIQEQDLAERLTAYRKTSRA